ncbi:MAG TPA: TetR/AcrR family transcriptional regulator [Pseudonocardiaceae bacterium]
MTDSGQPGRGPDGRAARWSGHRARRRAQIVAAALAAIDEHGPGVSTEQIAERAGMARPQLYRQFTDAQDLHNAIVRSAVESFLATMAPVLTHPSGSPRSLITQLVRTFVTWMTDNASRYHYVLARAGAVSDGEGALADARTRVGCLLRDLLAGYFVVLQVDPTLADPLAFGLVGMVESATERWLVAGSQGRDALVAQVSVWIWSLLDGLARVVGVAIDPDEPLPPLPDQAVELQDS